MLNLLIKDFKLLFSTSSSLKKRIFEGIIKILSLCVFIGFFTYLFIMILNKVESYPRASESFLILFLFIISIVMILIDLFTAYKLFFNSVDDELMHYPVSNEEIIASKLLFLLGFHFITAILFTFPIFLAYGLNQGRTPWYFFLAFFYPALSFLFEGGVALILVYPYKLIVDYLKKHILIQFIISCLMMIIGCLIYSKALSLFMDLVVNNNLNSLFTRESLNRLAHLADYMVPIALLVKSYLGIARSISSYLLISFGVFILGSMILIFTYSYLRSVRFNYKPRTRSKKIKPRSINNILVKKEVILLFKDSSNIFSFSGLLLVQPFLMYLVVDALNKVFSSGALQYYMLALPQFIPAMDIVLVMLFTIIINSGANSYIEGERHTMKIMKTMPVGYSRQLLIKVAVPFSLSLFALLVSEIVLIATGVIDVYTLIFSFLLTASLLVIYELASLNEELKIRNNRPRESFRSTLIAYLVPIVFFILTLVMASVGVNPIIIYVSSLIVIILLALPYLIHIKRKTTIAFMDLEVIN